MTAKRRAALGSRSRFTRTTRLRQNSFRASPRNGQTGQIGDQAGRRAAGSFPKFDSNFAKGCDPLGEIDSNFVWLPAASPSSIRTLGWGATACVRSIRTLLGCREPQQARFELVPGLRYSNFSPTVGICRVRGARSVVRASKFRSDFTRSNPAVES